MSETTARPSRGLLTRWLGVGLGSIVAVVTLSLAVTGRIGLFINPESAWWAVSMSVVLLLGAVASFAVPVDSEHEHEHEHEHEEHDHVHEAPPVRRRSARVRPGPSRLRRTLSGIGTAVAAVLATGVAVLALVLPPQSLSTELALSRDTGAPPLFGGERTLTLAGTSDTSGFGIGEWSAVLASTTDPAGYIGRPATLTGFVGEGDAGGFDLTRLVITHCVIDAQTASIPVADPDAATWDVGQWVEVQGSWQSATDGALVFEPVSVLAIPEPGDPYEY